MMQQKWLELSRAQFDGTRLFLAIHFRVQVTLLL